MSARASSSDAQPSAPRKRARTVRSSASPRPGGTGPSWRMSRHGRRAPGTPAARRPMTALSPFVTWSTVQSVVTPGAPDKFAKVVKECVRRCRNRAPAPSVARRGATPAPPHAATDERGCAALRLAGWPADDWGMLLRRAAFLLSLWLLAPATAAAAAPATTGGRAAPERSGGIAAAGQTIPAPGPRAARLAVMPAAVPSQEGGRLTFRYRIEGRARTVRATLLFARRGEHRGAVRVSLGRIRTGRGHAHTW